MLQKEEKCEENKMHISGMARQIQLKFRIRGVIFRGTQKNSCVSVEKGVKLQMCENGVFLTSVK